MKARWQTIAVTTWRNDKWYGGLEPLSVLKRKYKPSYDCVLIFFSVVLILKISCPAFIVLLWNKNTYRYIHFHLYRQTCIWVHSTISIWCLLKPTKTCFRKSSQASSSISSSWPFHLGLLKLASEKFPPGWNVDTVM